MGCIEQVYHLCPQHQATILHQLLASGHVEKLTQLMQGLAGLSPRPA
jgi:hypothetical protein